jgi:chemotaxis protein methyltransferase CheR
VIPTEAAFVTLKRAIIARTGHDYYADKDRLLRDRLERRLSVTGCADLADYMRLLRDPQAGAAEWQELEAEVTIGETFFFRHAEQFAALKDVILPALIDANRATHRIRIWSAGCAVGAEPYSVAILLERLLGPAVGDWSIDIVGSDINHRCLAQAREGRFSNWALRGMSDAARLRDFAPSLDGRYWHIDARHRPMVRFIQHNLLSLLDDTSPPDLADFDLILCRNVLIYFRPDQIPAMLSALARRLKPEGWLMVGHSDAVMGAPDELGVVQLLGTIAFRPPGCLPPSPPVVAWVRLPEPPPWLDVRCVVPARTRPRRAALPAPPEPGPEVTQTATIRSLADAGRLEEAKTACLTALAAHPLDHRLHFYDGVIAQARGEVAKAEAALRRAIYLRNDMVMAYYHLGLLLIDGASPAAGRRMMAKVAALCDGLPATDVLAESDGLRPADVIELVGQRLRGAGARRSGTG